MDAAGGGGGNLSRVGAVWELFMRAAIGRCFSVEAEEDVRSCVDC